MQPRRVSELCLLMRMTYDVYTEGFEGVRSTHVQVCGVKALEKPDVIEALGLWTDNKTN